MNDPDLVDLPDGRAKAIWDLMLRAKCFLQLGILNVRTLNQIGEFFETLKIDIFCVLETRTESPISIITPRSPNATSFSSFILRLLGDPASSTISFGGIEITLSTRDDRAQLDWSPVSSHSCAVPLRLPNAVVINRIKSQRFDVNVVGSNFSTTGHLPHLIAL